MDNYQLEILNSIDEISQNILEVINVNRYIANQIYIIMVAMGLTLIISIYYFMLKKFW